MSKNRIGYHWKNKPNAIYGFPNTIDYLCNFLHVDYNKLKVDPKQEDRRRFMLECAEARNTAQNKCVIHRDKVRKNLIIPAPYFIDRGFSREILCRYDIGLAKNPKIETKNRVIVPLYNEQNYLSGYTCRSIYDRCAKCRLFHDPDRTCPANEQEKKLHSKWRHIDFNSEYSLYNYWYAKEHIKSSHTAILVEGPGDVWKLEQNSIHNAVGMFGHTLYDGQERLLAQAQCMTIIVLTDNDEAGLEGAREIKKKYGRLYRMYFPNIKEHDVGDMNEDAITQSIQPYIDAAKYL